MIAGELLYNTLRPLVNNRVYPLVIPEGAPNDPPYIVYQVISSQPQNTLDGPTGHEWARVQLDIYDYSYDNCVRLSHDVINALDAALQLKIYDGTQQMYEKDSKLFRQSVDIEFWQTTPTKLINPTTP